MTSNDYFEYYQPNTLGNRVGDCTIRAICKATGKTWDDVFAGTVLEAYMKADMPSSNIVWHSYLKNHGFRPVLLPDETPYDYSVNDFCEDHPDGTYVVCLSGHVVCVDEGRYWDIWHSGDEPVVMFFERQDQ